MNLTMFQSYIGFPNVDGVYWTLIYEMEFYFAVFLILLFGAGSKIETLFRLWPFIMVVALFFNVDRWLYLGGYFAYFSAGALLAMLREEPSWKNKLPLMVSFSMCILFSIENAQIKNEIMNLGVSLYIVSVIIVLIFILFIVWVSDPQKSFKLPASKLMGQLTYPVYLIHAHFGYILLGLFATEKNKIIAYIVIIMLVLIVSFLINKYIERALQPIWQRIFMNTLFKVVSLIEESIDGLYRRCRRALP